MKDAFVLGGDDETNGLSFIMRGWPAGRKREALSGGWMDGSLECGQQRLQSRYALPTAEVSLLVIGALHLIRHEERQRGVDR